MFSVYSQDEAKTPIKQDIKKGNLRFYPYNMYFSSVFFSKICS
jgi:hypothetical protein